MSLISNPKDRLISLDFLRGFVMILMALDHSRDFFSNATFDPMDFSQTNWAYFLTRWVTHFCAPVFVFLAGTGAFFYGVKTSSKKNLFLFLFTRGIWLILLEYTIVRFGWLFNLNYELIVGQVIWAIGCSMIVLSFLIFLSSVQVGIIGLLIVLGHNLLDPIIPSTFSPNDWIWIILHEGGGIKLTDHTRWFIVYPVLPWIGVMAMGFGFGTILVKPTKQRDKLLLLTGFSMILLFIMLRFSNIYGDSAPWAEQENVLFTLFSFVNCTKYPPSLLYVFMTLGPAILAIFLVEKTDKNAPTIFIKVGRVPMFFYLLHLPIIHSLTGISIYLQGGGWVVFSSGLGPWSIPKEYTFGLTGVYFSWIIALFILTPLSYWYADYKTKNKDKWWLSYL